MANEEVILQEEEEPQGDILSFEEIQALAGRKLATGPVPSYEEIQRMANERRSDLSAEDFGRQLLSGIDDVTGFLASGPERLFGTITPQGVLGPREAIEARRSGKLALFGSLQAQEDPTTLSGRAGLMAGQTAAIAPLASAGLAALPLAAPAGPGASVLQKAKVFALNFFPQAGRTFMRRPVTTEVAETTLGAFAGAGGHVAMELFPDSDSAQLVGEIVGGTAPAFLPARLAFKAGVRLRNLVGQRMEAPPRVEARVRRAVPQGEARERAAELLEAPTTVDPSTGLPVLTPAQRTGEAGLLSLERAVMESTDELSRVADDQIWHANKVIQESMEAIGTADPSIASATMEESQGYLRSLIDTRIRIAAIAADDRLAQLGPRATREQANIVAREEVEAALSAARTQERELYALIPADTVAPTGNGREALETLMGELGKARQGDVPAEARRAFLNEKSAEYLGDVATVRDLRGLQSKLRETARIGRGEGKLNQARIADEIADAITDDIARAEAGPETADAVRLAVRFSKDLNDRFTRGTVGRILGRDTRGGLRVPESLTLEQSLGATGPRARQGFDDLLRAFDSPEAPSSQLLVGAAEDYMRLRFLGQAVEQGTLNVRRARRFLQENEELLGRLPDLRRQMEEAIRQGDTLALRQSQRARVHFDRPSIAKTTLYIQKGPQETFRQLSNMEAKAAGRELQKLINTVNKDATGEALEGLKAGFRNFLMKSAETGARDARGRRILSGFRLGDLLDQPNIKAMAGRLLAPDERTRLDIIRSDLTKLEQRMQARMPQEGVLGDQPSKVLNTLSRIMGAASGRALSERLGGGTVQIPGIMSNRMSDLASAGVRDPALRLITDAIGDEQLFRELLMAPLRPDGTLPEQASRRLNAWAAAVIAQQTGVFSEEFEEAEQ